MPNTNNKIFNALVNEFIDDELGHYNSKNFSMCLYTIKNDAKTIEDIKKRINKITDKYKFVILDKKKVFTNINVLDINL